MTSHFPQTKWALCLRHWCGDKLITLLVVSFIAKVGIGISSIRLGSLVNT